MSLPDATPPFGLRWTEDPITKIHCFLEEEVPGWPELPLRFVNLRKSIPLTDSNVGQEEWLLDGRHVVGLRKYIDHLGATGALRQTSEEAYKVNRVALRDDPWCNQIMIDAMPIIEANVGKKLAPSYSFISRYFPGSHLLRHTDISECHINVSIQISIPENWPLFVQLPNGSVESIRLFHGGAAIYRGITDPHWREEHTGKRPCDLLLLHYLVV